MGEIHTKGKEMESKQKKKRWILILLLVLLLLIICGGLFFFCRTKPPNPQPDLDHQAVQWNGRQELDTASSGSRGFIEIPGFDSLVFKADQITQKVNLYNPENNTCYMVITLMVEDDILWKSELIEPNSGFYEIDLNHALSAGNYTGTILYDCYSSKDLSALNGSSFQFKLQVK